MEFGERKDGDSLNSWDVFVKGRDSIRKVVEDHVFGASMSAASFRNPRQSWYSVSYPEIVRLFRETRSGSVGDWVRRVAAVYSWLPRIPVWQYSKQATSKYVEFEKLICEFQLGRLEACLPADVDSSEIRDNFHPRRQMKNPTTGTVVDAAAALALAERVLHGEKSANYHVSSSSKLLHFSAPGLFPILNRNISALLYDTDNPTAIHYHAYVCLLHEQLYESPFSVFRGHEASLEKSGSTAVRAIESILFLCSKQTPEDEA